MSTVEVAPLTRRVVEVPCGPVTEREWPARTLALGIAEAFGIARGYVYSLRKRAGTL